MDEKLTAIYCCVASADEYAIEAQKDYLCRYTEEHGYRNIRVYADNRYNGLSFDRPAFSLLKNDILVGKVQRFIARHAGLSRRRLD